MTGQICFFCGGQKNFIFTLFFQDFTLASEESVRAISASCAKLSKVALSFEVSRYEASGTTPAKREPLEIERPITVNSDENLFETYKEPLFNDTIENEEVNFCFQMYNAVTLILHDFPK